ncbi:MAG: glycosyltransferase family 2 protein [Salinivirgaceae bacterium]|nr:glycosyltransferase family 2 protein [Salinivirgaceae bacterium]MDY0279924.1 glycosyltransferase family 2 protein [Salinivirgaceae bacterium]
MTPISVVIITFNEEQNISRCLASVMGLADEIVVLDSFSSDGTQEICENYGVNFYQHKFDGHIEQKNRAIGYAKYPHVLSLDADEVLSDELKKSILEIKNNWSRDGFYFNRLTNYCGQWVRHCGWYPDQKLRLWDSRKGAWGGNNPHDEFILQSGCTQQHIKGDLLHYSYHSITEHVKQADNFTNITAQNAYSRGKRSSVFKVWTLPKWKFFRDYILKRGFLDGYYGYVICKISANATFLKYVKLLQLQKNKTL